MTRKILTMTVLMLALCMTVKAQGLASSLYLGYTPLEGYNPVLRAGSDKFEYNYKDFWGASIALDSRMGDTSSMLFGFEYGQGKFDKYTQKGTPAGFNANAFGDIWYLSMNTLYGMVLPLGNERFSIPLHIGPGVQYLHGGPFHNFLVSPMAQIRFKGYFTNSIGLYVGANARYNVGLKNIGKDDSYYILGFQWGVEAGLTIALGAD